MSDYQFTDKQINNFVKRCMDKKGWLNTRDVRSGNMPAVELRQLMKVAVDLGCAFDNSLSPESERYEICFNLEEKDRLLEEIEKSNNYFLLDDLLLSAQVMFCLPPMNSNFTSTKKTNELISWLEHKILWLDIYQALCRYQNREKIENFGFCFLCEPYFQGSPKYYDKNRKEFISLMTNKFVAMYKAVKIGWQEIKTIYPFATYNDLFIAILLAHSVSWLQQSLLKKAVKSGYRTNARKLEKVLSIPEFVKEALDILSMESSDVNTKKYYQSLLEQYERDPSDRLLDSIISILVKSAKKDDNNNWILNCLEEYYKSFSLPGIFHDFKSFDDFLSSYETGASWLSYKDTNLNRFDIFAGGSLIQTVLSKSTDPNVREALSEWENAQSRVFKLTYRIYRRNAEYPTSTSGVG